jgi:PmbA protein
MTEREHLLDVIEVALSACPADQAEVIVTAGSRGLTRFANNHIHQNVHEQDVSIQMRAVIDKRIGVASGNDDSPEALRDLAARAAELARVAAPNEEFVSLPAPPAEMPACDMAPLPQTVACGPECRAEMVRAILAQGEPHGLNAAGHVTISDTAVAVGNSLGARSFYAKAGAHSAVVMQAADSSGYAEAMSDDVRELDAEALGRVAAEKAIRSAAPRVLDPGSYTVILEPLAVTDLVGTLAVYDLNSLAHQEGRSFTSGHLGEKVCGENISIWDDGWDPRGSRMPYDFEGMPRQRVNMITNGVLTALPYDSFTAGREEGATNTGHALPAPNGWGPVPLNVFLGAGDSSVEEMVAATERGVLVTRFHYTNMIHPVRTVFTGMTRDGTFLVEDGQIVCGLKNMRFTQSILEALSHVDMIGRQGELLDRTWAPAIRVQGFTFSSATQF